MANWNPSTRLMTCIPQGKMIFITGTPSSAATRFTINLQEGHSEGCDLGLHFDVRFNCICDVNTIVCNQKSGGKFGKEERTAPYFPFAPNCSFQMIIMCESTGYKIVVNNQFFLEFKHRSMPFTRFDMLEISGDIDVSQIRFQ